MIIPYNIYATSCLKIGTAYQPKFCEKPTQVFPQQQHKDLCSNVYVKRMTSCYLLELVVTAYSTVSVSQDFFHPYIYCLPVLTDVKFDQ